MIMVACSVVCRGPCGTTSGDPPGPHPYHILSHPSTHNIHIHTSPYLTKTPLIPYITELRLLCVFAATLCPQAEDAPTQLYLVQSGAYRAMLRTADGARKARDYGPGDSFGGAELLCAMGGRACTVHALQPGVLWGIPRSGFAKLRVPPPLKLAGLLEFCESARLFRGIRRERMVQLMRGATQHTYAAGEEIFREDEAAVRDRAGTDRGWIGSHVDLPHALFSLTIPRRSHALLSLTRDTHTDGGAPLHHTAHTSNPAPPTTPSLYPRLYALAFRCVHSERSLRCGQARCRRGRRGRTSR